MKEFEVDLFNMSVNDETQKVFETQTSNNDGIFRPSIKDAKDKKTGYRAVIRFLPNFLESGKLGEAAIEKHLHYVDFKNEPKLSGFYDCAKNYTDKCDLCTMYWKLKKSKNQLDVEKAVLIKKTIKYYSYILVLEDEQHPEWVGKIMVYPYGFTIKEKINSERKGEVSGEPCVVFDLVNGKDFTLLIKAKGENPDYSMSQFGPKTPIKLYNEKNSTFVEIPTKNGQIEKAEVKEKIKKVLLSRTVNLSDHAPLEWDDEVKSKVDDILAVLSGNDISKAERTSRSTTSDNSKKQTTSKQKVEESVIDDPEEEETAITTSEDFFNID
jgi:hypothetical protein